MYRTIDTSLWTDPVTKKLPPLARLLFIYLITNSHTHVSGLYYLPAVLIPHETGIKPDDVDTLFDTLSGAGLVEKDPDRELIWVKNMFKYQGAGEKNQRAAANHLGTLHNSPLVKDFLTKYPEVRNFCTDRVSDTPSEFGTQNRNSNSNRNKEQNVPAASQPDAPAGGKAKNPRKRPAGDHAELIAFFCEGWEQRFGNAYDFQDAKDGAAAKRILVGCGGIEKAKRIVSAYLDDDDPFITKTGHTLAFLSSQLNRYLARGHHSGNGSSNGDYLAPPREPDEADLAAIRAGGEA